MKYMIIGAGGTGGAIGSHLAYAGHDVTFIARGRHLEAMRTKGLRVIKPEEEFVIDPVSAFAADEYLSLSDMAHPDVILVCVKGYSVDEMIPFISKCAGPETIVIPILNIFTIGRNMQEKLPGITVTDGCMYVVSEISDPGTIFMNGNILRVVFGLRKDQKELEPELRPALEKIRDDMNGSGIRGILSDNIERDALRKFSYVSPHGACGLYYGVTAGAIQKPGEIRECFRKLVNEVAAIADAMGAGLGDDIAEKNLKIMDNLSEDMTTSLQRDVARGGASEIDGLIYEVVRLADKYGVSAPAYSMIAEALKKR